LFFEGDVRHSLPREKQVTLRQWQSFDNRHFAGQIGSSLALQEREGDGKAPTPVSFSIPIAFRNASAPHSLNGQRFALLMARRTARHA
jgi:hypothetical protein